MANQLEQLKAMTDVVADTGDKYVVVLNAAGINAMLGEPRAHFRIKLATDDNDDGSADYVGFYSEKASDPADRPSLHFEFDLTD